MLRLPRDRKSQVQLGLIVTALLAFLIGSLIVAHDRLEVARIAELQTALISRDANAVRELVEEGANPNGALEDGDGSTALHTASGLGEREMVELLLANDADVSVVNHAGHTPLHSAAESGYVEIARLLVDHGGDPFVDPNDDGNTPVVGAVRRSQSETALYLLGEGRAASLAPERLGELLVRAASDSHLELVQFLVAQGADVNTYAANGPDSRLPHETNDYAFILFDSGDPRFHVFLPTPIQRAAWAGHANIVRFLVEQGASVNPIDAPEFPPLVLAARKGFDDIANILLEGGADPDVRDSKGRSALHVSIHHGHITLVSTVVEHGADTTVQDENGRTPLMILRMQNQVAIGRHMDADRATRAKIREMLESLIAIGFNPNAPGANGMSPVHDAALDNVYLLEALLTHGGDHSAKNGDGESPLTSIMYKRWKGDRLIMRRVAAHVLMEHGADPNIPNDAGSTPLHLVAKVDPESDAELMVDSLLHFQADPTLVNADGKTPAALARDHGHHDLAKTLEAAAEAWARTRNE